MQRDKSPCLFTYIIFSIETTDEKCNFFHRLSSWREGRANTGRVLVSGPKEERS